MKITSNNLTQSYKGKTPLPEKTSHFKPYEELNLMDSFLFESTTEKPENAVIIAKPIIERATGKRVKNLIVHPQKDLKGINISAHGIRMDVYTEEIAETPGGNKVTCVYDIEPNNYYDKDIPRRNRYYQSMIDSKLLPGGEPYKTLPDMYSIWILPYDPFGDNRMIYTVKNIVAENNQIVYNDGVTKIFLYTKGTKGGSPELKQLLNFMEHSTRENAIDTDLSDIMDIVDTAKKDPKERGRYMGIMGVIDYEKRDSYNEGVEFGRSEGIELGRSEGIELGRSEGIRVTINTCKTLKQDMPATKSLIMTQFNLTNEKADEYINLYW